MSPISIGFALGVSWFLLRGDPVERIEWPLIVMWLLAWIDIGAHLCKIARNHTPKDTP